MQKLFANIFIFLILQFSICVAHAEIYKWVDEDGKTHFSDTKPIDNNPEEIKLKITNSINFLTDEDDHTTNDFRKDTYRLPNTVSKVPFRFILTSRMNVSEPMDRLGSININIKQKSFYAYVKLTGVDLGKDYKFRIRVLDAKGELMLDQSRKYRSETNSMWFAARISPNINIDSSGQWTFQVTLNDEKLFVERRAIIF